MVRRTVPAALTLSLLAAWAVPHGAVVLGQAVQGPGVQGQGVQGQGVQSQGVQGPARAQERPPGAPAWHPLPAAEEKYLTDVLKYWEYQASQTKLFRCSFTRWEYDPVILPRNPEIAATVAQGNIQYAAPDKGLFKVEKLWQVSLTQQGNLAVPEMKGGKAQYQPQDQILGEHWVCDGKSVFEFDSLNKQLKQRELPAELQGKQIAHGPLPFLFGAKAQEIRDRYWIRVVVPPPKPQHFLLEAVPKRREDAADYRAILITIDEKEFLPVDLTMYERAGGHNRYEFANRQKNWSTLPEVLNPFHQQFYKPNTPSGWTLVREPFQEVPAQAANFQLPKDKAR